MYEKMITTLKEKFRVKNLNIRFLDSDIDSNNNNIDIYSIIVNKKEHRVELYSDGSFDIM